LKFAIPVLLLSLVLPVAASAQINPEAEAAYDNAMQLNEIAQTKLAQLVEWEQNGMPDKPAAARLLLEMSEDQHAYQAELRKASAGGHGVATYLLANQQKIISGMRGQNREERNAEACGLYQTAADQGLLAGAVTLLDRCRTDAQMFNDNDPEILRMRKQLVDALKQPARYQEHYPLPALRSLCFTKLGVPNVNPERPLSSLIDTLSPTQLTLEQFRADGYYLLAVRADWEGPLAREYFKQAHAEAPGCLDAMGMEAVFKAQDKKAR